MTTAPTTTTPARSAVPWRRIALGALLVGTAVLYLWRITVNGMGNGFYAAATQAGSSNWEALLFGSLDPHNFITVDKPPLSQWVMGLSGQLFGFSSASMLIPQALMAVGAVALLYAAVARICGPTAGLLAGLALALTPVAVLMFRFNNPDAVMVLLMTAAAYCTVRALERDGLRWLALAGVALGFAFLAKMLEGVMPAPALAAAYLLAAPVALRTRLLHLLGAAAAMTASAGWFVLLTMWWPASSRPYLAGSTDNSFMNLVLGYNGLSRIVGRNHGAAGQIGAGAGPPARLADLGPYGNQVQGIGRLFGGEFGYEIGWLLPGAVAALVVVLAIRGRAPRTDRVRAAAVLFGGWLLVDGLVLSYMHGMIHPYYTLSIAPAVAAMFAIGVQQTWARRETLWCRIALVGVLLGTGLWNWFVLGRNVTWLPGLRWAILVLAVAAAVALLGVLAARRTGVAASLVAVAVAGALAGSGAYAVATVDVAHQGGGPSVGPARTGHLASSWGRTKDDPHLDTMLKATHTEWSAAIDRSSNAAALELSTGTAVMAIGGFSGTDPAPTLAQFQEAVAAHRVAYYVTTTGGGHRGMSSHAHADIARWVAFNYRAQQLGDDLVYDLAAPVRTG
ncbi:glycosyltransferase family 39 protein [Mycolicibacterium sediminis]|uniref:Glycosyl transferase n=1 Tax=Mycolicibacterium sediminis TaxID=1286180 RepID=A0A7I7QK33_9MYCO|nr:glycosyltransferase family 39 protein [Mycolicibacterium sediminis]BBY26654.1 glycosyl transferase [Mycolicibacterium sediminis]